MEQGQWPTAADVKRRLGINAPSADIDSDVESALRAAIEMVEADCSTDNGDGSRTPLYDPEVIPDRLAQAAVLLTASTYKAPDAPYGVAGIFDVAAIYVAREHPTYANLLKGYRGDFGIG